MIFQALRRLQREAHPAAAGEGAEVGGEKPRSRLRSRSLLVTPASLAIGSLFLLGGGLVLWVDQQEPGAPRPPIVQRATQQEARPDHPKADDHPPMDGGDGTARRAKIASAEDAGATSRPVTAEAASVQSTAAGSSDGVNRDDPGAFPVPPAPKGVADGEEEPASARPVFVPPSPRLAAGSVPVEEAGVTRRSVVTEAAPVQSVAANSSGTVKHGDSRDGGDGVTQEAKVDDPRGFTAPSAPKGVADGEEGSASAGPVFVPPSPRLVAGSVPVEEAGVTRRPVVAESVPARGAAGGNGDAAAAAPPAAVETAPGARKALSTYGLLQSAERALESLRHGDLARFEQILHALEQRLGSRHPFVNKLRAYRLLRDGQYEQALPYLKRVLAEKPDDLDAGINMAVVEMAKGDLWAARARLNELRVRYPGEKQVERMLAGLPPLPAGY